MHGIEVDAVCLMDYRDYVPLHCSCPMYHVKAQTQRSRVVGLSAELQGGRGCSDHTDTPPLSPHYP